MSISPREISLDPFWLHDPAADISTRFVWIRSKHAWYMYSLINVISAMHHTSLNMHHREKYAQPNVRGNITLAFSNMF